MTRALPATLSPAASPIDRSGKLARDLAQGIKATGRQVEHERYPAISYLMVSDDDGQLYRVTVQREADVIRNAARRAG